MIDLIKYKSATQRQPKKITKAGYKNFNTLINNKHEE